MSGWVGGWVSLLYLCLAGALVVERGSFSHHLSLGHEVGRKGSEHVVGRLEEDFFALCGGGWVGGWVEERKGRRFVVSMVQPPTHPPTHPWACCKDDRTAQQANAQESLPFFPTYREIGEERGGKTPVLPFYCRPTVLYSGELTHPPTHPPTHPTPVWLQSKARTYAFLFTQVPPLAYGRETAHEQLVATTEVPPLAL